jgi:uncharacterized protein (DUF433 family)
MSAQGTGSESALRGGSVVNWADRIVLDPKVIVGKPAVKGTRRSVERIIESLANGWTEVELLDSYPRLTHDDILACLCYAAESLKSGPVCPIPPAPVPST